LLADGWRVESPILPGHEPVTPVMPASRWRDWVAVAEQSFDRLAQGGGPVAVVGFSTGATLALWLTTCRSVARQVLLAPFLAVRYSGLIPLRPILYLSQLARIWPHLPRRPPAVRDVAMRRWVSREDRFRTFNLRATVSALELIEEVKQQIATITVPTLIIQGRRDTVVEPANAMWLYRNLGSPEKRLIYLEGSDHLVALDRERDRVLAETLAFLKKESPST
jgi:carboxylesterase